MDIITFSEGLQKRINEIDGLTSDQDDLVRLAKALSRIRHILKELKIFTVTYSFREPAEEIRFFKEIKPVIFSQFFYYKKMFALRLYGSFNDKRDRIEIYHRVLKKLQRFAEKNRSFYEYCMSGATHMDNSYFTRNNQHIAGIEQDENFSTGFDTKLSKILTNELFKKSVLGALHLAEENRSIAAKSISWTDSKVALIELIYALSAAGAFNNGKADLKQIVQTFEDVFSIELGNYARVFSEIRMRKSGQTNFLDNLKDRLSRFINSFD